MKKYLVLGLLLISPAAFAQLYIQKCTDPNGGIVTCSMGTTPGSMSNATPNQSSSVPGLSIAGAGAALSFVAPQVNGNYDSRYPGNIFAFCSGGRPGRHDPLRAVYDTICPKGKVQQ